MSSVRLLPTCASFLILVFAARSLPAQVAVDRQRANRGRELFTHTWKPHDEMSPSGDGLGPMRNADSCLDCHFQGGPGGSGPRSGNVHLLSVVPPKQKTTARRQRFERQLTDLHPGFRGALGVKSNIVFHRFGLDQGYEHWRRAEFPTKRSKSKAIERIRIDGHISFFVSQRNTPALFGSGLIDQISRDSLEEIQTRQSKRFPDVSGRVPEGNQGDVGRFGWRGQTSTLDDFVLAACANELGLQSKNHRQAKNPLAPNYRLEGVDLTEQQCDEMIAFVAMLSAPQQVKPADRKAAEVVEFGEGLFHSIGCTACHVRDLGPAKGIFSDLLLHDLGQQLADPVIATKRVRAEGSLSYSGFSPIFEEVPLSSTREWRTPPLWGVADSAPYLHDGRAATLTQAIIQHGGEALFSVKQFTSLSAKDRRPLIAFLETLKAPPSARE